MLLPLVAAIEAQGWTVWWDPEIDPGQEFDRLIAAELKAAAAVLVVWTPDSVTSRCVRDDARAGRPRQPRPCALRSRQPDRTRFDEDHVPPLFAVGVFCTIRFGRSNDLVRRTKRKRKQPARPRVRIKSKRLRSQRRGTPKQLMISKSFATRHDFRMRSAAFGAN